MQVVNSPRAREREGERKMKKGKYLIVIIHFYRFFNETFKFNEGIKDIASSLSKWFIQICVTNDRTIWLWKIMMLMHTDNVNRNHFDQLLSKVSFSFDFVRKQMKNVWCHFSCPSSVVVVVVYWSEIACVENLCH